MTFADAEELDLASAFNDELIAAWHAYAGQISYHHADDSGREWGRASALMPHARQVEVAIRERGLPRPTGQYLMSQNDRIDWETGEWSPGWSFKKERAA